MRQFKRTGQKTKFSFCDGINGTPRIRSYSLELINKERRTMSTYFVINLAQFTIKKNHPNTIFFKATCPVFSHIEFELEYTGPDLNYTMSLPSEYMDKVCKEMQVVFGYEPFEKSKVKCELFR